MHEPVVPGASPVRCHSAQRSCIVWIFSTAHVLCGYLAPLMYCVEFMYCVVIQLDYETQIVTLEAQVLEGVNSAQQLVSSPDVTCYLR